MDIAKNGMAESMEDGVVVSAASTPAESILETARDRVDTPATDITPLEPIATSDAKDSSLDKEATLTDNPSSTTDADSDDEEKPKKTKPRVLKTEQDGIYTIKTLEAANFVTEWYKGLRASTPYMIRLIKIYWSMSPTRASILVVANLFKAFLPSLSLWVSKEFLDQVQHAADGRNVKFKRLMGLALLGVGTQGLEQGLNIITDKVDGILERRLGQVLDTQLIEAYLKLDADQLASRKVRGIFTKVILPPTILIQAKDFAARNPSNLIITWLDSIRYILTIATSSFTLSRLMSQNARNLILLSTIKVFANLYRLAEAYSGAVRYEVLNKAWHRLNLMKTFCLSDHLRRDISATGLEPWLLSEFKASSTELGDTSTKAPYMSRARSGTSFTRQIILNLVNSAEYTWLIYEGFRKGMSLGTLHLIRSSTDAIMEKVWGLAYTGDRATDEWKSLISFFRCLELKSELVKPADPKEYVSSPAGMKLEAKSIRYKYDLKKDVEVLKGASFIINPGEMVAVVGFNGAGKSTLARLLTRLANVTGGEFLINDIDVKNYDPAELRKHIAVLFQDIGQYHGLTILENIGVGKVENLSNEEAIKNSAKDAGASEFIDQLPYKYDSYLGTRPGGMTMSWGVGRWDDSDSDSDDDDEEKKELEKRVQKNLSGGQWQKIALARAFMRGNEADLLVLDEPTANLDPEAEYNLFETIKKLRRGKTTVYISHRFNTVRAADRIMVMEEGDVKEFGTHEELMAIKEGRYHRLYTLQAKGFLLDDKGGVSKDIDGMIVEVKEKVVKEIVDGE